MTTEETLSVMKDLLATSHDREEYDWIQERIEELEMMLHYEQIMRSEDEGREN